MDVTAWVRMLACAAAACSGGKAKAVEDARRPVPPSDTAVAVPAPARPYRVDPSAKMGDVQIRVEWKDVPQALRASPGATPCGHAAPAALAPTTLWGIPDAVVSIDVDHGKPLPAPRPRIVLEDCLLAPRVAIAGETLALVSATEQPATLQLAEIGKLPLGSELSAGAPRTLYLPVVGHEVETALAPGTIATVTFGDSEVATVVAAPTPYVAITDATGRAVLRDVPIGTHPVRAWLPGRGALEPRVATATVTVGEGALAEVTVDIGKP